MRKGKWVIAWVLALVMALGCLSTTGVAEELVTGSESETSIDLGEGLAADSEDETVTDLDDEVAADVESTPQGTETEVATIAEEPEEGDAEDFFLSDDVTLYAQASDYASCTTGARKIVKDKLGITLSGSLLAYSNDDLRFCCDARYKVGKTPKANSLAMWGPGGSNSSAHVAFVSKVSGSSMYIMEGGYHGSGNWSGEGGYHEAWVPTSGPEYGSAYGGNLIGFVYLKELNHDPVGTFDSAKGGAGKVTLEGFVVEPDDPSATVTVKLYANGPVGTGALVGSTTTNYWGELSQDVTVSKRGSFTLYAYALDTDTGKAFQLSGTHKVTVTEPKGNAVTSLAEGRYVVRTKLGSSYGLDVQRASKDNSANVLLYKWGGAVNQQYDFVKNSDGTYTLKAAHSGKAVEVQGASVAAHANVIQYTVGTGNNQRWWLDKNTDGTYTLRNKASGMVLEVSGGEAVNSANVWQNTNAGWKRQMWYLVPVDASKWSVKTSNCIYNGSAQKPAVTVTSSGMTLASGTDYTVSYANNVQVGTATITVKGTGGFTGTKTATFKILDADISLAEVSDIENQAYTGSALTPKPATVTMNGAKLTEGVDYTVSYDNNVEVGEATLTLTGAGHYTGTKTVSFQIEEPLADDEKYLDYATVELPSTRLVYNGKAQEPDPIVKIRATVLRKDIDYTVSYEDNVDAGEAYLYVEGIGEFSGEIWEYFEIEQADISAAKVACDTSKTWSEWQERPYVTVTYGDKTLVEDEDYYVYLSSWSTSNGGSMTVTVGGEGNYTGTVSKTFTPAADPTSWSGATKMPLNSIANYQVTNGSIKVKSGADYVEVSGTTVRAKKTGTATLALVDKRGTQVATQTVKVYALSGNYEIESAMNSNFVLDIQKASKENSAKMLIYTRNGGKNQQYQFVAQSDGSYGIKCVHSGKFVDVQGGGTKQGQNVIQYTWNGKPNQRWYIVVDARNRVSFQSVNSGMYFDVKGGKAVSGAYMIQYPGTGGNNQKWWLKKK